MTSPRISLVTAFLGAILVPLLAASLVLSTSGYLASRRSIEDLNRRLMGQSMMRVNERTTRLLDQPEATYLATKDDFEWRFVAEVQIKGREAFEKEYCPVER